MLTRLLFAALLLAPLPVSAFEIPSDCRQCLVATADGWDSSSARLQLYEKAGNRWQTVGSPWNARLGKKGLAWGTGIHPVPNGAPAKREGDWKSPAGVFALGGVWGYDSSIKKHPKLYYRQITPRDLWVEDSKSPQYNRNVILDHNPATTWEKKQQMKQNDPAHALKLFIAHNSPSRKGGAIPYAGSSIFFHIWRGGGSRPTAGCTAMPKDRLQSLIARLDPAKKPLYVLLPQAQYKQHRKAWKLP